MMADELHCIFLKRFPALGQLSASQLERIVRNGQLRTAPEGAVLFDVHQPCAGFPLLLEGCVRVTKTAANGGEIVLR